MIRGEEDEKLPAALPCHLPEMPLGGPSFLLPPPLPLNPIPLKFLTGFAIIKPWDTKAVTHH